MQITLEINGRAWTARLDKARSIAIGLDFAGPQPSHFGAERASARALELGEFIGDTRRGGSCNVEQVSVIAHCNGTHTESVSHIVNDDVPVGDLALAGLFLAELVSVPVVPARDTDEAYRPELDHHDVLVTRASLEAAMGGRRPDTDSLVIRTLPNQPEKKSMAWGNPQHPAFLTMEAMEWIAASNVRHLLLDLPSVDRMYDEGLLTNHHIFWNVPAGTHSLAAGTRRDRSITEMVFVEDSLPDGRYLLNLQVPAWMSDAAPSRPVLYPVEP